MVEIIFVMDLVDGEWINGRKVDMVPVHSCHGWFYTCRTTQKTWCQCTHVMAGSTPGKLTEHMVPVHSCHGWFYTCRIRRTHGASALVSCHGWFYTCLATQHPGEGRMYEDVVVHFRRQVEVDDGRGEAAFLRGTVPPQQTAHGAEPWLQI